MDNKNPNSGGPLRPLLLSGGLFVLSIAFQLSQAKGWADFVPDGVVYALWFVPIIPLGWWLLSDERLKGARGKYVSSLWARPKTTIALSALATSIICICLFFIGIKTWHIIISHRSKTDVTTPMANPTQQGNQNPPGSPSPKVTTPANVGASTLAPPEARLLMSKAYILPLGNTTTGARAFGVNFVYANRGSIPTTGQVNSASVAVSDEILTREEIIKQVKDRSSFKALPELRKGGDEIYPNDANEHFISIPDSDEKTTLLAPFFDDVMAGKKKVYFFVTIKYRDKSMGPSVVGVSETCGWFLKDLDVVHNCGVDRIYSEVEK